MAQTYVFTDEAGDFSFSKQTPSSKYFIVCSITLADCEIGHRLFDLRRKLIWEGGPVKPVFHATEDKQEIRDAVYKLIQTHDVDIQATILEKDKADPDKIRPTRERFYKYAWLYHFRHGLKNSIEHSQEVLITTASVATNRAQRVFTEAVNDVVGQTLNHAITKTDFVQSQHDPCLQIADYCTWAIQRKWERGDVRSYDLIKDKITREYDLFKRGTMRYY